MLDLNKLHIFVTVAGAGSFSAGAERLYITQSAVSQHIKELETSLGRQLFTRGSRGVRLTPAGELLHGYAREILALAARADAAVTDVEALDEGRVSIGATPGVSIYLAPDWVSRFRARYPRLTVALQTGITAEIAALTLAGRLDLGIIEGEPDGTTAAQLDITPLAEVAQAVVIGPRNPLWDAPSITLEDLNGQSFIVRPPNSQTRQWFDATLRAHGITPVIGAEFDNIESIKRAVGAGPCITVLPPYVIAGEVAAGALRAIPLAGDPLRRVIRLIRPRDAQLSPVAGAFLRALAADYPLLRGI